MEQEQPIPVLPIMKALMLRLVCSAPYKMHLANG